MKVAAHFYNRALQWNKEVTIDTKSTAYLAGSVLDFEKLHPRGPNTILKGVWDAEEPIGSTWGYSAANPVENFRSPQAVITLFCEVLSLGGNLLLNLSPDGQGALSEPQITALKEVGKWLEVNGPAVYGSHAWIKESSVVPTGSSGRNANITYRFIVKGDDLFAIAQSWPGDTANIPVLVTGIAPEGKITSVALLGSDTKLEFMQDEQGLKVKMPAQGSLKYAFALKISGLKMNPPGEPMPAVMADVK